MLLDKRHESCSCAHIHLQTPRRLCQLDMLPWWEHADVLVMLYSAVCTGNSADQKRRGAAELLPRGGGPYGAGHQGHS